MKRLIAIAALAAGSLMTTPAMAAEFALSSTDASSGTSWFTAPHIGNGGYVWVSDGPPTWGGRTEIRPLSFDHSLKFNVGSDSLINVNLWQSETGITFDSILLNGVEIASNLTPGISGMPGFFVGSGYAQAGAVTLQFLGSNIGNPHSFGGTLNISAAAIPTSPGAVPEPATWIMMLGGMALAGAALRRRSVKFQFA